MAGNDFTNVDLPEGYSGGQLRAAEWWLVHKDSVRRVAIGFFIAFDVLLVGIGLWGLVDWLALGGVNEERAMRQLTSPAYARLGGVGAPQEIAFDAPIVLAADGSYDVLVPVENRNEDYWAEIEYVVTIGGEETRPRTDFVLPGQSKYLLALGLRRDRPPGRAELRVVRREWRQVDPHAVGDYASFAERRLAFDIGEADFVPGTGDDADRTTFTARNASAFGYRSVGFTVILYRGSAIAGVNRVAADAFRSGERRVIDLFWFQDLPQVTRTQVFPDVNVLDPDAYLAPGT